MSRRSRAGRPSGREGSLVTPCFSVALACGVLNPARGTVCVALPTHPAQRVRCLVWRRPGGGDAWREYITPRPSPNIAAADPRTRPTDRVRSHHSRGGPHAACGRLVAPRQTPQHKRLPWHHLLQLPRTDAGVATAGRPPPHGVTPPRLERPAQRARAKCIRARALLSGTPALGSKTRM